MPRPGLEPGSVELQSSALPIELSRPCGSLAGEPQLGFSLALCLTSAAIGSAAHHRTPGMSPTIVTPVRDHRARCRRDTGELLISHHLVMQIASMLFQIFARNVIKDDLHDTSMTCYPGWVAR